MCMEDPCISIQAFSIYKIALFNVFSTLLQNVEVISCLILHVNVQTHLSQRVQAASIPENSLHYLIQTTNITNKTIRMKKGEVVNSKLCKQITWSEIYPHYRLL